MAKIHRVRPPTEIPQSSLADVAFLLLVFFIATTTIGEEFGLSLILPAKSANHQAQEVNRANVTVITTDPSGDLFYVDGVQTRLREIRDIVKERQAANDKLIVSVEPDRNAPYRAMVDILDELKLAKATRISLKTRRQ
jgi:biopolymer transport protein ExbD